MKIAIIGGGASGLACAVSCALYARDRGIVAKIDVYEKNDRVGKKLLSTGNGRCNLTNLSLGAENYPFCHSFAMDVISRFPPLDCIAFFERLGLYCHADGHNRVYPLSGQASAVLDALRLACGALGVNLLCSEPCTDIACDGGEYVINRGRRYTHVVLCCGSRAAVREYNAEAILKRLGIAFKPQRPSLVRFKTDCDDINTLAGVRASAKISLLCEGREVSEQTGELQFVPGFVSGIAAMQLSCYAQRRRGKELSLLVDFAPSLTHGEIISALSLYCRDFPLSKAQHLLTGIVHKRVGLAVLGRCKIGQNDMVGILTARQIELLADEIKNFEVPVSGTDGFDRAQVCAGGVELSELDSQTLEVKRHKNLYCCGEIIDVDGLCGGYNLQFAWSSARLCAESITGKGRADESRRKQRK